jgi:hypothetical protein
MVTRLSKGEIEALDVRANVTLAKNDLRVVCPTRSLTVNRGHDGTGIHCGVTDHFLTDLDNRQLTSWNFGKIEHNWKINRALYFFRGRNRQTWRNLARYHLTRNVQFGR